MRSVFLFLDDTRPPWTCGCIGYEWVKTAEEAIEMLKTGEVAFADLDHDLGEAATLGDWTKDPTGYEVVCWMEETGNWPSKGVRVHSMNVPGKARMLAVIERHYGKTFQ